MGLSWNHWLPARIQLGPWARSQVRCTAILMVAAVLWPIAAQGQPAPIIGQEGKDVPWVPTPDVLVETMLDMAGVTGDDFVIDLGSGDGRTVIEAATRGARARGVELEPNLVAAWQPGRCCRLQDIKISFAREAPRITSPPQYC